MDFKDIVLGGPSVVKQWIFTGNFWEDFQKSKCERLKDSFRSSYRRPKRVV